MNEAEAPFNASASGQELVYVQAVVDGQSYS